jgi:hypothetical protein
MTSSAIRLVPGPEQPSIGSIIVTTEPKLFAPRFAQQLNSTVFIFDNRADALACLDSTTCGQFFADYRELEASDRWSGHKFLRHLRDNANLTSVKFWLMANRWDTMQEQWAKKRGAAGFVRRSPDALAERIIGEQAKLPDQLVKQLDGIDVIFGRLAGPMRSLHVEAVREALATGAIEPTLEAYCGALANKFALPERSAAFRKALQEEQKNSQ